MDLQDIIYRYRINPNLRISILATKAIYNISLDVFAKTILFVAVEIYTSLKGDSFGSKTRFIDFVSGLWDEIVEKK